jgi:carboxypeptidase PM20D1
VSLLAEAVTRIHSMPITHSMQGGPALDMMRALSPQLSPVNRAVLANEWLFGPLLQAQFARSPQAMALMGTTNAPTVISGGSRPNVLPGEATALINLRIHPRDTAADLLARAKHAVAGMSGVSVEWDAPPLEASPVSSTDSTSYALIAALAHAVYPQAPVAPCLVVAGTDSRHYSAVAENIYRFQAIVLSDEDLEGIHGVNEHLSVDNLGRMIHFYIGLMQAGAM